MQKFGVLGEYCARCLNLVFWGNIAPSAGRKNSGLRLGFKGGVPAKLGGVSVVFTLI